MDLVYLIGLVFVACLAILIFASRNRPDTSLPDQKLSEPHPEGAAFEAASAKPVAQTAILQGRAYVVDGDTITIKKTQIRLYGIDAPELEHPYGQMSKWAMVKLCKGHIIRAEIAEQDAYGRTVAKCFLPDGRDLSAELVKLGLAIDWPKYSGGVYSPLEVPDVRKKLWLAHARQRGWMHLWDQYESKRAKQKSGAS